MLPGSLQGRSCDLWQLHIPLHGPSIMFIKGLVTREHSSTDNIVATAMQYSVDIGARQRNNKSRYFRQLGTTWDVWQDNLGVEKCRIWSRGWLPLWFRRVLMFWFEETNRWRRCWENWQAGMEQLTLSLIITHTPKPPLFPSLWAPSRSGLLE